MNATRFFGTLFLIATTTSSFAFLAADEDTPVVKADRWTQWRGPQRDGRSGSHPWPESLSSEVLKRQWHVSLDESYSGPIVIEDRVFVTGTRDKKTEIITALDRKTGEQIWETSWAGAISVPFFAKRNGSWIRATPAYDDGRLYVAGIEDVLVCLDADSGKILWKRDFPQEWGGQHPTFGFVCSPLVYKDHVYVQAGGAFVKLDKKTGETVWKTLKDGGGMMGGAFSSPVIATANGKPYLVVQTRTDLAGVNIDDGTVLWKQYIPSFRGMNIVTPVIYQEQIFTSTYKHNSQLFALQEQKDGLTVRWEQKGPAYMSTPVVIDRHAYMHLQNNRISCLNMDTGEETWRSGESFGGYWSMVYQNDRIMALDEAGELILLKANPAKFEILDRREVSNSSTWAHLAVAGNQIFVRELKGLTTFTWE
ncbi:MAG: PQQ-binding-like beta-propeller repeat protein [Acidobacteriota bacterium]|nr:PQQ-binding-like beta-propeller repeat protein [Acidobacteriota bacterium]